MEERRISKEYEEIAKEVINKEPSLRTIRNSNANIVYLLSDKEKKSKGGVIFAQCEKIPDKFKGWATDADYAIVIFEPNCEGFTRKQKEILMHHELLHINIKTGKDGEEKYSLRPHDYEDFKEIIDRFGTDWCNR